MAAKPAPGERRLQILHMLAELLQDPKGEKITTALLAKRLDVSEAALYRHFASKAQMFEALIEFIETSLFSVINRICAEETSGLKQAELTLTLLLGFAEKNRGLTRVLTGDALVNEDDRLQLRINQMLEKLESGLKQTLKIAASAGELAPNTDVGASSNLLLCWVMGRWMQYAQSGFTRAPLAQFPNQWPLLRSALAA